MMLAVGPSGFRVGGAAACLFGAVVVASAAPEPDLRLVQAVRARNVDVAATLITQKVDPNAATPDGTTALHWAAHWADLDTTRRLLRAGAKAAVSTDIGITPLALACESGSAPVVSALLDAGADANAATRRGETVLMACSRAGNLAGVQALLRRGADVEAKDPQRGQTALMLAAAGDHADIVAALLDGGADIHARTVKSDVSGRFAQLLQDYRGGGAGSLYYTPVLFAARSGAMNAARVLLDRGANVNDVAGDSNTALLTAVYRGHWDLATFLLSRGADPNLDGGAGFLPLHWASGAWETLVYGINGAKPDAYKRLAGLGPGKADLVKALLAHGADPNARLKKAPPRTGYQTRGLMDVREATPLILAAHAADVEVMRLLLAAGADPAARTEDGSTVLMAAAGYYRTHHETFATQEEAVEVVKLALDIGNDPNAGVTSGDTPLHAAAHWGSEKVAEYLIARGADFNAANESGRTPLGIAEGVQKVAAEFYSWPKLQTLFRKHGASSGAAMVNGPITVVEKAACPDHRFRLVGDAGDTQFNDIVMSANTVVKNGTCADLIVGARVRVRGTRDEPRLGEAAAALDRVLFATEIEIDKGDPKSQYTVP